MKQQSEEQKKKEVQANGPQSTLKTKAEVTQGEAEAVNCEILGEKQIIEQTNQTNFNY